MAGVRSPTGSVDRKEEIGAYPAVPAQPGSTPLFVQLLKCGSQPLPRSSKIFRQNSRLGDCSHEVGVSPPSRHGVHMQMSSYPRARRLTEVQTEVEPMRPVEPFQRALSALRQIHHLVSCLRI